jgi:hypothetical protein
MKTFIIFALVVMTSTSWARDLQTQLEDCDLLNSQVSELKVCDFVVETRDTAMHGTVCSFKRDQVQQMAIYLITPGWMNNISADSVSMRKCIKTSYNSHNRQSCQRMLNFDASFRLEDDKLKMSYDVGLELSFKDVPVTYKHLKCRSVN